MPENEEKSEQETIEDALFVCLKAKLDEGTIKAMDARMLLEITERRAGRVPKGPPIVGLLQKLPFSMDEPITK